MKFKKTVITVIAIALLVGGGGAINTTYAAKLQEQTLIKVNNQMITPLWNNISIVVFCKYNFPTIANIFPQ